MTVKTYRAKPEHDALMADFKAVLRKHEHLHPVEMLAIAAQLVGNLIAFQDQRALTPDQAIAMVSKNIEVGNQLAIDTVLGETKGNA